MTQPLDGVARRRPTGFRLERQIRGTAKVQPEDGKADADADRDGGEDRRQTGAAIKGDFRPKWKRIDAQ